MDNLYKIQAVNPELAFLLRRVKTIFAICGGDVPIVAAGKRDDFQTKKSILIAQLHNFMQLVDARDTANIPHDSRDYIRLKASVNVELERAQQMLQDLAVTHKKELDKKGGKMDPEEVQARKEVMEAISGNFREAFRKAKGYTHAEADDGPVGINYMSREQLEKGQFAGAGIKTKREALTGEQMQQMEQINIQTREQDMILDEIGKQLDELKELGEKMHDELTLQDKMLTDLEGKTEKTQATLDKTNERLKDALKQINDKSSNCCVYIICIVMLLGIIIVVVNVYKTTRG